jgi:hypothetical protein
MASAALNLTGFGCGNGVPSIMRNALGVTAMRCKSVVRPI